MLAIIFGVSGQDGYYLTNLLKANDVKVIGISRKTVELKGDISDFDFVDSLISQFQPDYIFHLAANANVKLSFTSPSSVLNNNINGTVNLLEGLRILNLKPVLQLCGTSEVYGQVKKEEIEQDELSED